MKLDCLVWILLGFFCSPGLPFQKSSLLLIIKAGQHFFSVFRGSSQKQTYHTLKTDQPTKQAKHLTTSRTKKQPATKPPYFNLMLQSLKTEKSLKNHNRYEIRTGLEIKWRGMWNLMRISIKKVGILPEYEIYDGLFWKLILKENKIWKIRARQSELCVKKPQVIFNRRT